MAAKSLRTTNFFTNKYTTKQRWQQKSNDKRRKVNIKLSYRRGPRDALCQLKSCQRPHNVLTKNCIRRSFKVVGNGTIRYAIYHFLLVACSKNVSVLHHFRDITTLKCTRLRVTFKSSLVLIQKLKLHAAYAFQFSW